MEHVVLGGQRVRVAEDATGLLGFAAVGGAWLEQLWIDPDHQRLGWGRMLLHEAEQARPAGLWLHVSTRNVAARCSYEASGFVGSATIDDGRPGSRRPCA